jgi:hypothetical protein
MERSLIAMEYGIVYETILNHLCFSCKNSFFSWLEQNASISEHSADPAPSPAPAARGGRSAEPGHHRASHGHGRQYR